MVERRDHRAGDEADAPGAGGDRRQKHAGIGRMAAVVEERVLDRLDRAVAEGIGALGKPQALRVIVGGGAVFRAKRGKEVDAEFHGSDSKVPMPEATVGVKLGGASLPGDAS